MGQQSSLLAWSLSLLAIAVVADGLIATSMLAFLPQGKLFGITAFQVVPCVYMLTWGSGITAAYRRSRSIKFVAKLAVVGVALLLVLPICLFIAIFLITGPLQLR